MNGQYVYLIGTENDQKSLPVMPHLISALTKSFQVSVSHFFLGERGKS